MKEKSAFRAFLKNNILTARYVRFLLAGGGSVLVNLLLRILLSEYMGYQQSIAVAYLVSTCVAFTLNRNFVFERSEMGMHREMMKFFLVNLFGLLQTLTVSTILDRIFEALFFWRQGVVEAVAHVLALSTLAVTSFLLHKGITFSGRNNRCRVDDAGFGSAIFFLVLPLGWTGLALLVNPLGNFPLNDDWSYGRSVQMVVEQRGYFLDGWNTASVFFQVMYGALFCKIFGFSFSVLRISSILLGCVGGLSLFCLARQLGTGTLLAVIAVLTLVLNPVYYANSFTFMTDVPFTAMLAIGCVFLVRSMMFHYVRDEVIAGFLLCLATMIRQIALPVAVVYGLVVLARGKLSAKCAVRALLPAISVVVVQLVYDAVIGYYGMTPPLQDAKQQEVLIRLSHLGWGGYMTYALKNVYSAFVYLCLFCLPLQLPVLAIYAVPLFDGIDLRRRRTFYLMVALVTCAYLVFFVIGSRYFSLIGNTFSDDLSIDICGMERNCAEHHLALTGGYPNLWVTAVSALAVVAALSFWGLFLRFIVRDRARLNNYAIGPLLLGLIGCVALVAPFCALHMFDRYFLPPTLLMLVALLAAGRMLSDCVVERKVTAYGFASIVGAVLLITVGGALAVMGTHDLLAWNRARWLAVSDLVSHDGVALSEIDGGFEVSGWNLYTHDPALRQRWNHWFAGGDPWAIEDARYVVGFYSGRADHRACEGNVIRSYPFSSWLSPEDLKVAIFRQVPGHPASPDCRR